MVFNSLQFLVFFGIVTSAYFLLAHKYRWALLLAASCYFYMAFVPVYLGILGLTIVIDYFAGIYLERFQGGAKKIFLGCSLLANLGVLAIFKYYFFFTDNVNALSNYFSIPIHFPVLNFLLPIGLSFHTFQAMSYTIEVYRGNQKAERNFGIYSLYVMFYPQLVAGPIERPQNLIHQFYEKHVWDTARVKLGLLQMMQGFFKKVVIADRLAMVVDPAYANLSNQSSLNLIIASIFYSFQIYCDFSGYSDIAIGASKVMGFKLMNNFNAPYTAKSIPDFWRRWHISLSTWFKDYVYFSLGGNRVSVPRWYINIMIVFILSGFWHGASWNFVIWGALHGLFQLMGLTLNRIFPNLAADEQKSAAGVWMYRLLTFLLVTIAWVFFRIPKFGDIQIYFGQLTRGSMLDPISLAFNTSELLFSILLIVGLYLYDFKRDKIKVDSVKLFWPIISGLAFLIYFFGVFNLKQFIYFQF
jgi:D-alanyl-lipoteichoic acid acyltransferase DltB (MBOAT superfamily)